MRWQFIWIDHNWVLLKSVYVLWRHLIDKSKVKQSSYTQWRRLGGRSYSSYSFTTSALDGGEWWASRSGRSLPPGKGSPVPIGQEGRWALEQVWTQRLEWKSFRLCRGSNLNRPVVQSVVRHYTDWATPAPIKFVIIIIWLYSPIRALASLFGVS
jgi:hypothetical protein